MSAQPKSYKKLVGVAAAVIVVIFLIVLFLPIIPVTYEVTEPRQKTETYWEKEPYQVTKTTSEMLIDDKPTVSSRTLLSLLRLYRHIRKRKKPRLW